MRRHIDSIESAGNYVAVNAGKDSHILRETLNGLERQLDPEKFLRVSRSAIVNLAPAPGALGQGGTWHLLDEGRDMD